MSYTSPIINPFPTEEADGYTNRGQRQVRTRDSDGQMQIRSLTTGEWRTYVVTDAFPDLLAAAELAMEQIEWHDMRLRVRDAMWAAVNRAKGGPVTEQCGGCGLHVAPPWLTNCQCYDARLARGEVNMDGETIADAARRFDDERRRADEEAKDLDESEAWS